MTHIKIINSQKKVYKARGSKGMGSTTPTFFYVASKPPTIYIVYVILVIYGLINVCNHTLYKYYLKKYIMVITFFIFTSNITFMSK